MVGSGDDVRVFEQSAVGKISPHLIDDILAIDGVVFHFGEFPGTEFAGFQQYLFRNGDFSHIVQRGGYPKTLHVPPAKRIGIQVPVKHLRNQRP
jgi:hypothetical protein